MMALLRRGAIPVVALSAILAFGLTASGGQDSPPQSDKKLVRSLQTVFRSVVARLNPSVVRIDTVGGSQPSANPLAAGGEGVEDPNRPSDRPFRDTTGSDFEVADGPTSGLIWSSDGYIITSSFNFVRDPLLITVTFSDGTRTAADLVARDQVRKIALLKVDARDLPSPVWSPKDDLAVGQWSLALGRGYGGDSPSIAVGIVSALNRMSGFAVQTDAKLSAANYGGPLSDIRGRVIGICVPMALRPGELAGIKMYDTGVGFVVPKHRLDEIVPTLLSGQSIYRGWLGVSIDRRATESAFITNVASPSPMEQAGVEPGDRIVFAAGREIRSYGDLTKALSMIPAGETVDIRIERTDAELEISVRLVRGSELGALPELAEPVVPDTPEDSPDDESEGESGDGSGGGSGDETEDEPGDG